MGDIERFIVGGLLDEDAASSSAFGLAAGRRRGETAAGGEDLDDGYNYSNKGGSSQGSLRESSIESVDTRTFRKGALILSYGGLAISKTLLNAFQTKTSVDSRDSGGGGGGGESSLASESLQGLSCIGSGGKHSVLGGPKLNSLTQEQRLTAASWDAFQACSSKQGDYPCDGGSRAIHVASLVVAMRKISNLKDPTELARIVQDRQYPSNALLSFKEFQSLVHAVFRSDGATNQSPARKPLPSSWSLSETAAVTAALRLDQRDKSAYRRLLQKQRGAASIVLSTLPPDASTDIGISESIVEIDGKKVSTHKVNDAMIEVFRNDARFRRMDPSRSNANSKDIAGRALLKHKVYGMTHASETYAAKWERMRVKREEREEREMKRAARSEMIETLNRLVLTDEKRTMKDVKQQREIQALEVARRNVAIKAAEEQEAAEKIWRKQEQELDKKRETAAQLKAALSEASLFSRSLLEDEMEEKKKKVVPFHLNPCSSALITVPEDISTRKKKARSLESYNSARKAEKDFLVQTLDSRIKRFSHAKYEKMFKAADIGVRVSLTPFTPISHAQTDSSTPKKPNSGMNDDLRDPSRRTSRAQSRDKSANTGAGVDDIGPTELGAEDDLDDYAMREYLDRRPPADDDSVNSNRRSPTNTSPTPFEEGPSSPIACRA